MIIMAEDPSVTLLRKKRDKDQMTVILRQGKWLRSRLSGRQLNVSLPVVIRKKSFPAILISRIGRK